MLRLAGLAGGLALALAGCVAGSVHLALAAPNDPPDGFAGDLLVLVDADMPAFAYADGVLTPRTGARDGVHRLRLDGTPRLDPVAPAGNTVTHWPGAMAVAPDGRHVYVVEGRGPAPEGVDRVDDVSAALGPGRTLSVLAVGADGRLSPLTRVETAPGPNGVSVALDGSALVVSTDTRAADLQIVPLRAGRPHAPITVDLAFETGIGADAGATLGVSWSPRGDLLALNLGGGAVAVAELVRDARGAITGVALRGGPVVVGRLLSQILWARDGRTLYALDTGWGPRRIDRVLNGRGAVHVIRVDGSGNAPELVQSVPSGLSSEAFALSPDGRRLVTLNMERTYLPPGFPTGLVRGRGASSVSLFAVNPVTSRLAPLGDPVPIRGVLPQGIVFDAEGDDLAVAVFQDHDPASVEGWVQFLRVEGNGAEARLSVMDARVPTPRGAHFLLRTEG